MSSHINKINLVVNDQKIFEGYTGNSVVYKHCDQ